ncbi:MAG: IS66 family transposase [Bacteroidales bacterium]|nr:IS66 family transposase [Bacteroidales bacterium]
MPDQSLEIQRLREELACLSAKNETLLAEKERLSKESEALRAQEEELVRLNKVVEKLRAEKDEMQAVIDDLRAQMAWFRKKFFASMSEKHLPLDPNVLEPTLFDTVLSEEEQAKLDAEVKKMEEENAKAIEVKAHRREVRKPLLSNSLPVEEEHLYPAGVKNNPDYVEIGVEVTETLGIRPAVMFKKRIIRHKFVLKSNLQIEDPDRQAFLIAPLPETIRPKSMADASLLADILINKYIYHLPFYRQIQKYKELGVLLNDATINDWFAAVCEKLRPLYERLRVEIMSKDYIQVDESTLPVIDNEKHRAVKGYMWAVRDALGGSVYFHYDNGSRGGDTARKLIGAYRGAVQTDGYEVYTAFENTPGKRMIGCWAHARRKFVEALEENKKYASEAIVYIGKLYKIEEEMREAGLDAEAIRKRRQEESYPIICEFEKWMDSVGGLFKTKTRMGKALTYTFSLLPRLSRYVLDGRYHIDNNGIENAIRPLALGRKNYLFAGNHEAAVRAAIVYSLFSSCKAAGIEPREWLEDILVRIPSYTGDVGALLPCNWQKVAATCGE